MVITEDTVYVGTDLRHYRCKGIVRSDSKPYILLSTFDREYYNADEDFYFIRRDGTPVTLKYERDYQ